MFIDDYIDGLSFENPYSLAKKEKEKFLFNSLTKLHDFHLESCTEYKNFSNAFKYLYSSDETIYPFLPVRLFKNKNLKSTSDVFKTLNSSGTSGNVSKIYLDRKTASRQTRILNEISKFYIGNKRLPMCIIDSKEQLIDRTKFNARAAGILGYSVFGRDHFYCLDENLDLKLNEFINFIKKYEDEAILFFGFTYLIWSKFTEKLAENKVKLKVHPDSLIIHGGGWKKLVDLNVSNDTFKSSLKKTINIQNVYNYYGMIEQVGSVFMECSNGMLHCSNYSDVIIRDKFTYKPLPIGHEGLINVISILPTSYPGNSILTEDVGVLYGVDDCPCGNKGKYFQVSGRLPKAELRGCSDTRKV